jgi:hypothetical protein
MAGNFNIAALLALDGKGQFNDPFMLPSKGSLPMDFRECLELGQYMYYQHSAYRRATQRVVSHFMTSVDFVGRSGDSREQTDFRSMLVDHLDVFGAMAVMGEEWGAYGNSFYRLHLPFNRVLLDRRDDKVSDYSLAIFKPETVKYLYKEMLYEVPDPRQQDVPPDKRRRVKFKFADKPSKQLQNISLRRIDPMLMHLDASIISGKVRYIMTFDADLVKAVHKGDLFQVGELPIAMLRAIANDQDFLFDDDQIFHFKAPQISGVANGGWGVPEIICNYQSLHMLQVYRKIDEAVGLDYMQPFRIFSPRLGTSANDLGSSIVSTLWRNDIKQMIANRRKDPFAMHAVGQPLDYQEVGASGKELAPKELIEFQTNDMLDAMGYPAELYRGTMSVQQIPTTIRIFENSFHFMHRGFDNFLKWVARRVLDYLNRERMTPELRRSSMADDIEQRQVMLQLASAGEIPRSVAYRSFGITDPVEAAKQRGQEDIKIQENQQKMQQEYERKAMSSTLGMTSQDEASASGGTDAAQSGGALPPPSAGAGACVGAGAMSASAGAKCVIPVSPTDASCGGTSRSLAAG